MLNLKNLAPVTVLLLTCSFTVPVPGVASPQGPSTPNVEQIAQHVAATIPNNCEILLRPPASSPGLHFPEPFWPTDNIYEAWCKMQNFGRPTRVSVRSNEAGDRLLFESAPTLRMTKQQFAASLVRSIYTV